MKKLLISSLLLAASSALHAEPVASAPSTPVLSIDFKAPSTPVSPILYGLMTEEINCSYDGGLYAELIQNRVFRDDDKGVPVHWSVIKKDGAEGKIGVTGNQPLTDKLTKSLVVEVAAASAGQRFAVANDGYWGIPLKPNTTYRVSFYVKGDSMRKNPTTDKMEGSPFTSPLQVSLENTDGSKVFAQAQTPALTSHWQKVELTLKTGADVPPSTDNRFVISAQNTGKFWVSLVSLFPPTYQNRPNGLRVDLMEKMVAMNPKFIRFPGGNYLEGYGLSDRFPWKETLGPLEFRPGHPGTWRPRSSDGMGLLEFMSWCEDLHAQPVLAVFAGYSLNRIVVEAGPLLEPFVREALEEVEYLTGDAKTTYWGAMRARNGHPEPFQVNYVEIGNEDGFDKTGSYDGRFTQFYDAFKAKYPQIQLIATDRTVKSRTPDIFDDHFYRNAEGFYKQLSHYDKMDRKGPKVFVGEWATREGDPTPNFNGALGDAAWMTSMERNSDLIVMQCYAPLFVNINPGAMRWKPNLIGYNGLESYGSPAYYAQVMFANHIGDVTPKSELKAADGVFLPYSVTRQTAAGKVFLKVVNPSATAHKVKIELNGLNKVLPNGEAITLSASGPKDTNTLAEPKIIVPVTTRLNNVAPMFDHTFPAWSITVLELNAQ